MHTQTVNGSPPRMRGKVSSVQTASYGTGITPAYAGKSCICLARLLPTWDHPRVCGEKLSSSTPRRTLMGSPPRMRGKVDVAIVVLRGNGITPAYAGKSLCTGQAARRRRDHPRVCGEKKPKKATATTSEGSPPRMRGKDEMLSNAGRLWGITPAYAGKRLKRFRSTVSPVAIVPLFPSVCNKPVVSDGSPAGRDAPLFLPAENAVPASPAYNLRSL